MHASIKIKQLISSPRAEHIPINKTQETEEIFISILRIVERLEPL